MKLQLNWKCRRGEGVWKSFHVADLTAGRYMVRDANIWKDSRVIEMRDEAVFISDAGMETHLGYYPNTRAAIDACEQHHQEGKH